MRRLMLDSGAFSVWSQGESIDLDKYIDFCAKFPDVSYYVNLDVIPGKPNQKRTVSKEETERSALAGWDNYRRMIKYLPFNKVIPVFHQNEDEKWLIRYLQHETPYIGISPANDRTTAEKKRWFASIRRIIFMKDGTPRIKTHGFAVTSYDLMKFWDWYSVDSASWKLAAAWGGVYIPQPRSRQKGDFDFSKPPYLVGCSPASPTRFKRAKHFTTMSPLIREIYEDYIFKHLKLPQGSYQIIKTNSDQLEEDEIWFDRKTKRIIKVFEEGVETSFKWRAIATAMFMKEAAKVLPVKHLYFAGAPLPEKYDVEKMLNKRLLSYHTINTKKGDPKCLLFHLDLLREKSNA